jgi:hypothetical protein
METTSNGLQSGSNDPHVQWHPSPEPYCSGLQVHAIGISGLFFKLTSVPVPSLGRIPKTRYKYVEYAQVNVQHTLFRPDRGVHDHVVGSHVIDVSPPAIKPYCAVFHPAPTNAEIVERSC